LPVSGLRRLCIASAVEGGGGQPRQGETSRLARRRNRSGGCKRALSRVLRRAGLNLRIVVVSVLLFSVRLDLAGRLLAVQHAQPCCIMLVTQLAIAVGACARMGGPRVRPRGCPQAWGACFRSVDVVHYVRGGPQSLCPARARGACATRPRGPFSLATGNSLAAGNSWDRNPCLRTRANSWPRGNPEAERGQTRTRVCSARQLRCSKMGPLREPARAHTLLSVPRVLRRASWGSGSGDPSRTSVIPGPHV